MPVRGPESVLSPGTRVGGGGERFFRVYLGFPKIKGAILGVPILRIIEFWDPYLGPPILVNYHLNVGTHPASTWWYCNSLAGYGPCLQGPLKASPRSLVIQGAQRT